MADRKKRGEDGNTKIWISWEWKELFLDEIKSIFHNYLKLESYFRKKALSKN